MKRREFIKQAGIISGAVIAAPLLITSAIAETKPLTKLSSLDRVNASRMIVYIKRKTEDILHNYIFEPNDVLTRSSITSNIDAFLAMVLHKDGIQDYTVICDESNNSPKRVDAGDLYVDMAIKLNRATGYVYLPVKVESKQWLSPAGFNRGNGDYASTFAPYLPL